MPKNTCTPQRIYGSYEQTLFLGCSILSYTVSAGWGDQNSELTVEIVQDPCSSSKLHYSNFARSIHYGPDPGFTEPNIGAPAFFKVANFEFSGLIQSYDRKDGPDGNPVFSVKLIDPRVILGKVQIIVDNYEGTIGGMHNLINVYGFLESLDQNCPALTIDDMVFGAPAGGFGSASRTDRGIPWNKVRPALAALIGNDQAGASSYSMGGVFFRGGGTGGYGEIDTGLASARYIVDLTELPSSPDFYRIQGPVISLMDLISQVCQDAGCDYYIELLPTGGALVIKVRVLVRNNQPAIGTITSFINSNSTAGGGYGVITDSIGRELRAETNNSFIIGSKQRNLYEEDDDDNIVPYWGRDLDGNLIESRFEAGDWAVKLDFRRINLALFTVVPKDFGWVGEAELRHALGDFQTFVNWISQQAEPPENSNSALAQYFFIDLAFKGAGVPHGAGGNVAQLPLNAAAALAKDNKRAIEATQERDMKTLYNWLNAYAGEFYGKQYLVQSPWVCYAEDTDSQKRIWTNLPSTEGGWSEQGDVLGITNPSLVADFFKDEKGMWNPILTYELDATVNIEDLSIEDYMKDDDNIWVRGTISDKWVVGSPVVGESDNVAQAHIMLSSPVVERGIVADPHEKLAVIIKSGLVDKAHVDIAGIKNGLGGRGATVGAVHKRAIHPIKAGVPIVSNVATYGPWQAVGKSPGTVRAEVDEGLAPWEYGGAYWMNKAGITKAQESVTEMQYTERGQVTIPGYPQISIGAALDSAPNVYLGRNLSAGNAFGFSYQYVQIGSYNGGASTSSINVTVSPQGVTTSYTISTFTPVFGRFYKGNANRIKQIGLNRLKGERDARAKSSIKSMLKLAAGRARARANAIKQMNKGDGDAASPGIYLAGKLLAEDGKRKICVVADSHTLPYYEDYDNTAVMSMDGLVRPVSKYGDAGLPQTNDNDNVCAEQGAQSEAPPPPPASYTPLKNTQVYLDYLADATSATTFFADDRVSSSTSGHDIEALARLTSEGVIAQQPSGAASIVMHPLGLAGGAGGEGLYSADYRHMALRGPLMIHGWGYDIYGKPIPNAAKDNDPTVGEFHDDYTELEDKFATNWLSDARTWPVAPVDLRFDRKRGVWTTPPAFRMYQVQAVAEIAAGADGTCNILASIDDLYDEDGNIISSPTITVKNFHEYDIAQDNKFMAYYDTRACEYWAVGPTGGAGGGGGCDGITTSFYVVTNVCCDGDTLDIDYSNLSFTEGCLTTKVDGGGPSCP